MTIGKNGPGDVTLGAGDRAAALDAVRQQLRIVLTDDDALIVAFVETALGLAEQFTRRVTIARTMTATLAGHPTWQVLGAAPVRTIGAVAALNAAGVASVLPVDGYAIDVEDDGGGWVRVPRGTRRFAVTFEAGLAADWAGLPAPLRHGVILLAAHLFTARDASEAPPAAVTALWRPFRAMTLGRARAC